MPGSSIPKRLFGSRQHAFFRLLEELFCITLFLGNETLFHHTAKSAVGFADCIRFFSCQPIRSFSRK